jgi:hypothetical protein
VYKVAAMSPLSRGITTSRVLTGSIGLPPSKYRETSKLARELSTVSLTNEALRH